MTITSAEEFAKHLTSRENIINQKINVKDIELNSQTQIILRSQQFIDGVEYVFSNCTFYSDLTFLNVRTSRKFAFHNCQFRKGFEIDNFISEYSTDDSPCLIFRGCKIDSLDIFNKGTINTGLEIFNSEIRNLKILSLTIVRAGIQIKRCNIVEVLSIFNTRMENYGLIVSDDTTIKVLALFSDISAKFIRLDFFSLKNCVIENFATDTFNCSISSGRSIEVNGIKCRNFSISNTKVEDKLIINVKNNLKEGGEFCGSIDNLTIKSSTIRQGLTLNGFHSANKSLQLDELSSINADVSINDLSIESLNFEGINQSVIILDDITIKNLTFRDFVNRASLFLKKINPIDDSSRITVSSSILGATYFSEVEFDKFENIIVEKTDFSEVNQSVYYINELNVLTDSKDNNKELRELFRQLKHASEKQGNRIQALEYQALEMKYFQKEIKQNPKEKTGNTLILLAGSTNDFGQNFLKPIWLLFCASLFFFPTITLAVKHPINLEGQVIDFLEE